jgi:spoIIIJ-associated protein
MEELERSAESVEEAVEAALAELGLSEQEVRVQILQEPRSGFFGRRGQPAIVRVRPLSGGVADAVSSADQEEAAVAFIEGLLDAMGMDADVEVNEVEGITYVDLWGASSGDDMGLLIGKHGHTVDALQELMRGHVQRTTGTRCAVQVDVEDYRKRRRSRIVQRAGEVARRVKKSGRPESLEPMTAYERKIVHDAVAALGDLETASEGDEPQRRVVIRRSR